MNPVRKPVKAVKRKVRDLLFYRQTVRRVTCTLRHETYEKLIKRSSGRKPAVFVRDAALAYLEQRYLVPADIERRLVTVTALIRNIAGNLNQIAAKTNTLQRVLLWDLKKARERVLELEDVIRRFVRYPEQG